MDYINPASNQPYPLTKAEWIKKRCSAAKIELATVKPSLWQRREYKKSKEALLLHSFSFNPNKGEEAKQDQQRKAYLKTRKPFITWGGRTRARVIYALGTLEENRGKGVLTKNLIEHVFNEGILDDEAGLAFHIKKCLDAEFVVSTKSINDKRQRILSLTDLGKEMYKFMK